jgi:hypothetical protein
MVSDVEMSPLGTSATAAAAAPAPALTRAEHLAQHAAEKNARADAEFA